MTDQHVAVAIVGGGPSGLTAAAALAPTGRRRGPRHRTRSRDRRNPAPQRPSRLRHARSQALHLRPRLRQAAHRNGAGCRRGAGDRGDGHRLGRRAARCRSPHRAGIRTVTADAVVLATGARERPRPARLIPGDRPDGVYTTGQLQNLVHLHHAQVGSRALIVGAELVSWSAVLTLREAGCATVGMVSGYPRSEAYAAFRMPGRLLMNGPVFTRSRIVGIHGKDRVRSAVVENIDTGSARIVDCDTVVFTGDWIPDHELARTGGLAMDPATRGPVVDAGLRTSSPGVFAVGNLLHPVDTADGAALDGRHVAAAVQPLAGASRRAAEGRPHPHRRRRSDGLPRSWSHPMAASPPGATCCSGSTSTAGCRSCGRCRTAGRSRRSARRGPPHRAGCTGRRGRWWRTPTRPAATSPSPSPDSRETKFQQASSRDLPCQTRMICG